MTPEQRREKVFAAQRAGTKARLTGIGMSPELADRWLRAWSASSNMEAEQHSLDFWDRGFRWAADAHQANQKPPAIEG
jgi:hypothetical protein